MKKTTRILTLVLVLVMAVSLLPMAAAASTPALPYIYSQYIVDDTNITYHELFTKYSEIGYEFKGTIAEKVDFKPDPTITYNGQIYDLHGVSTIPYDVEVAFNNPGYVTPEEVAAANKWLKENVLSSADSIVIPPYPETNDNNEQDDWCTKYTYMIFTVYGAHHHVLSGWYKDNNNHWMNCKVCKEQFVVIDWHHDYDEDDFCDICGHEIIYYDITIKEVDGVKITISGDRDMTAPYRDMIDVKVEAEDGYQVTDVRVWKIRENGTKDQIRRTTLEKGTHYEFKMQNFDCEIVPTVIKK